MNRTEFLRLWDVYGGLLTGAQREVTDLYLNKDLTVSEIAEGKGISRQAVSECLTGCKKQLADYEQKLKFSESNIKSGLETGLMLTDTLRLVEKFAAAHPEFSAEMREIAACLKKDYSAEAEAALSAQKLSQQESAQKLSQQESAQKLSQQESGQKNKQESAQENKQANSRQESKQDGTYKNDVSAATDGE